MQRKHRLKSVRAANVSPVQEIADQVADEIDAANKPAEDQPGRAAARKLFEACTKAQLMTSPAAKALKPPLDMSMTKATMIEALMAVSE